MYAVSEANDTSSGVHVTEVTVYSSVSVPSDTEDQAITGRYGEAARHKAQSMFLAEFGEFMAFLRLRGAATLLPCRQRPCGDA